MTRAVVRISCLVLSCWGIVCGQTPGPATRFSVIATAIATAGTGVTVTVTALDASNAIAAAYAGTVRFTSSDPRAVLPANTTLTNGTRTFPATIPGFGLITTGDQTITVTDVGTASITGQSNTITVSPQAPAKFVVSQPGSVVAGVPITITVKVVDTWGNVFTNQSGLVHFTANDPLAILPPDSLLINGVMTGSVTFKTIGPRDVVPVDLTGPISIVGPPTWVTMVTAAAPAGLAATGGSLQSTLIGAPFASALQVKLTDTFGNAIGGAAVTFASPSSGASAVLSSATAVTDRSGDASITATANFVAGSYVVTARTGGLSGSISLTNTANVTVQTSPPGLSVMVDGSAVTTPRSFGFGAGSSHGIGMVSPQTGGPGTQYVFASWSDGGAASHSIAATVGAVVYTAQFNTQYQLTTSVSPAGAGQVIQAPGTFFNSGSTIQLQAVANSGYAFSSWSAGVTAPANAMTTLTMNAPQFVVANFSPVLHPGVNPPSLAFQYYAGSNAAPPRAVLNVNTAAASLFTVASPALWLSASPSSGASPGSITVALNPSSLAPGSYSAILAIGFPDGSAVQVPVQLQVLTIELRPTLAALAFTAQTGITTGLSQTVMVAPTASDVTASLAVSASAPGGNWLSVSPASGDSPLALTVRTNPSGLGAGIYQGAITVALMGSGSTGNSLVIPVSLAVTDAPPSISVSAGTLRNAANALQSELAPNTIVSAFGSFPGCSDAQVTAGGRLATVFYSSPSQINFLLGPEMADQSKIDIRIACAGLVSQTISAPISTAAPAVFVANQSGTGQAVVVNQDGSINTPCTAGTYIQIYGTGFGSFGERASDGLARLRLPVTAKIAGAATTVLYAGEAPGFTSGLQQINLMVPADLGAGSNALLEITLGDATTQAGVLLLIR